MYIINVFFGHERVDGSSGISRAAGMDRDCFGHCCKYIISRSGPFNGLSRRNNGL